MCVANIDNVACVWLLDRDGVLRRWIARCDDEQDGSGSYRGSNQLGHGADGPRTDVLARKAPDPSRHQGASSSIARTLERCFAQSFTRVARGVLININAVCRPIMSC